MGYMLKKLFERDCSESRSSVVVVTCILVAAFAEVVLGPSASMHEPPSLIGRVVIAFLTLYIMHRVGVSTLSHYRPTVKDIFFLTLVQLGALILVSIGQVFAIGLHKYSADVSSFVPISTAALAFAIPYASAAMLLQTVLGLHFAVVFSLSFALLIGIYSPTLPLLVPYVLATSLIGCLSLTRFRSRLAYLRAGIYTALIALPIALAAVLVEANLPPSEFLVRALAALVGGILCSFIAAGFTPMIEYFGGYVTDLRLIEMATLDHPLLKELSIQSPGTWNHSMVMGMMVESAADAVEANPVVARVGAYFHDIGKTKKPLYFVENQMPGENRHDKLSTSMSALIIRSHVKDGIELARAHGLPRVIEDMIPQHHGTSIIEYFYEKACKDAEEAGEGPPDVSLYSYPGPKPQTKEAGILMLADGIEAATRTIPEPTLDRIQGLVQKMINRAFRSGQLDECELTLIDLHRIAKCFTRVLNGIYHQRIAYAEPAEKIREKDSHKESANASESALHSHAIKIAEPPAESEGDSNGDADDLKRLGLSVDSKVSH